MARWAKVALRSPARAISSSRVRRAPTRANSAATKKALARTRAITATRPGMADPDSGGSIFVKVSGGGHSEGEVIPRRLLLVLALTAVFMVVEAVAGWLSGALALLADAGHMLIDVAALALSAFTAWIVRRPAT